VQNIADYLGSPPGKSIHLWFAPCIWPLGDHTQSPLRGFTDVLFHYFFILATRVASDKTHPGGYDQGFLSSQPPLQADHVVWNFEYGICLSLIEVGRELVVFSISSVSLQKYDNIQDRCFCIRQWHQCGGDFQVFPGSPFD
jgi:hypothetical protein